MSNLPFPKHAKKLNLKMKTMIEIKKYAKTNKYD